MFDFQSKVLHHCHYALTVHCLRVLRLLLVSCFSASCSSVAEPHLCSKQIKSTWSESLRESLGINIVMALFFGRNLSTQLLSQIQKNFCCYAARHHCAPLGRAAAVTVASRGPYNDYYEKLQVKSNTIVQHSMALLYAFICQVIALLRSNCCLSTLLPPR